MFLKPAAQIMEIMSGSLSEVRAYIGGVCLSNDLATKGLDFFSSRGYSKSLPSLFEVLGFIAFLSGVFAKYSLIFLQASMPSIIGICMSRIITA